MPTPYHDIDYVTSCGRIFRHFPSIGNKTDVWKELKPFPTKDGYLRIKHGGRTWLVHRLVMHYYKGDSPKEVNHIDGNKRNNCINNLEYCTHKENMTHAMRTGLMNPIIKERDKYGRIKSQKK